MQLERLLKDIDISIMKSTVTNTICNVQENPKEYNGITLVQTKTYDYCKEDGNIKTNSLNPMKSMS